jgi:hypothetical protein
MKKFASCSIAAPTQVLRAGGYRVEGAQSQDFGDLDGV